MQRSTAKLFLTGRLLAQHLPAGFIIFVFLLHPDLPLPA